MFSSIRDLFNRRNGDESKSVDPNAIQVTIEKTTYSIPVAAVREIVQTAVRETLEQVLPALLASQRRSPYDRSPFESPFRSRRSPFSSPFGDENDEDGTDALAAILAMAMMARQSEENGDRTNDQDDEDQDEKLVPPAPADVIAAYKARELSDKASELALTVLATWDNNQDVIMAPEIGFGAIMAARSIVEAYRNGERDCACGEDDCMIGHAMRTLNLYVEDEEYRRWAEDENEGDEDMPVEEVAEPMMAGTVSSPEEVAAD